MISNVGLCATWESADHSWQELTESMSWTPKGTEQWKKAPPSEPSFSSDKLAQSGKRNINQCYASANCLPIICGHEDRWVQPWHVYISTGKASSLRNKKTLKLGTTRQRGNMNHEIKGNGDRCTRLHPKIDLRKASLDFTLAQPFRCMQGCRQYRPLCSRSRK